MAEERKELDIVPSSSKTIEEALGGVQIELSKIQQQRELPEVPGFTKEELELRDIRQRSHGGIYYAQERTNRHMIAQVSLYVIYEIGRYIMNEGNATGYIAESYLEDLASSKKRTALPRPRSSEVDEHEALTALMSIQENMEKHQDKTSSIAHPKTKNFLLFVYHGVEIFLRKLDVKEQVIKRVQALIIYKVALDHMDPKDIYNFYKINSRNASMMTVDPRSRGIPLPNGGSFKTDHAINSILPIYIASNPDRFREVMKSDEINNLQEWYLKSEMMRKLLINTGIGDITIGDTQDNNENVLEFIMGPHLIKQMILPNNSQHRSNEANQLHISPDNGVDGESLYSEAKETPIESQGQPREDEVHPSGDVGLYAVPSPRIEDAQSSLSTDQTGLRSKNCSSPLPNAEEVDNENIGGDEANGDDSRYMVASLLSHGSNNSKPNKTKEPSSYEEDLPKLEEITRPQT